ncbi:MAG: DUF547 domain-containing protein [Bacteroidetes bacterium]|nr:DUF547 domain-containing protein [Bacteroidota bacterium]
MQPKTIKRKQDARRSFSRRFGTGVFGLLILIVPFSYGQATDSIWEKFDSSNTTTIDHSDWQAILDTYLVTDDPSGIHLFDYQALQENTADRQRLNQYLEQLQELDPRQYARDVQMAYWINLYNAVTIRVVVDAYPVESIMQINNEEKPNSGPWKDIHATVAGIPLTLDNIEHDILRPIWQDNRIHYAVNCASLGCPNLASQAFTAANLEQLLDENAKEFVNHLRAVELLDEAFGVTSSLYFWYMEDFGDSEAGVLAHLQKYADEDLAEQLKGFEGSLDHEYDWRLNVTSIQ